MIGLSLTLTYSGFSQSLNHYKQIVLRHSNLFFVTKCTLVVFLLSGSVLLSPLLGKILLSLLLDFLLR